MADYKELLRRAISALPENHGASRRAVYEKARSALVGQLRAITPPLPARHITQHRLQLEDCIRQVEQEASEAAISLHRESSRTTLRSAPTQEASGLFPDEPRTAAIPAIDFGTAEPLTAIWPNLGNEGSQGADKIADKDDAAVDLIAELSRLMAQDAQPAATPRPAAIGSASSASIAAELIGEPAGARPASPGIVPMGAQPLPAVADTRSLEIDLREEVESLIGRAGGGEPALAAMPDAGNAESAILRAIEVLDAEARGVPPPDVRAVAYVGAPTSDTLKRRNVFRSKTVRVLSPPANAAAPAQRTDATGFTVSDSGLDIAPVQIHESLAASSDQQEAYSSLREEAGAVLSLGTNFLGDVAGDLRALVNVLPEDIAQARVFSVWRAGNKLRRIYRAHLAVENQSERHLSALDPAVAEMIGGLCEEFNNLAAVDPGLRQRDAWRLPPSQRGASFTEEFDSIEIVVNEAIDAAIVSPEAIAEVRTDIPNELPAASEMVIPEMDLINRTRRNFVSALIGGAFEAARNIALRGAGEVAHACRTIFNGFYSNIGTGAGIIMVGLVIGNSAALRLYATKTLNSPAAVAAIEWMVKLFGSP